MTFGLSVYSVKLPSIIIGTMLGGLLILLLNRWFKNNVALLASILAVLSASFLYLAGSGTPLIMLVFWPTLLLWLDPKSKVSPNLSRCTVLSSLLLCSPPFLPHTCFIWQFLSFYLLSYTHTYVSQLRPYLLFL